MFSSRSAAPGLVVLTMLACLASTAAAQQPGSRYPGIGRAATAAEVKAWDIDVRPDFKGLPPGSGSVARGMVVWEAQCASCHGVFGESNEVFSPIVGGTTQADIASGRVARLQDPAYPQRTSMMKLATLSTLWDYIHRAMPWTQPRSLSADDVYATTAYILNLAGVVADDFTLSHHNIAQVQARLPNRNGMSTDHGLWPGRGLGNGGRPDVQGSTCMQGCAAEAKVASVLPEHARNAHGNLAEQNRSVGPQRGADTTRPAGVVPMRTAVATSKPAPPAALALAQQHHCMACHGLDNKLVGPGLRQVAARYRSQEGAAAYLAKRIAEGGGGVWGSIAMPAQNLPPADAHAIATWLAQGAP